MLTHEGSYDQPEGSESGYPNSSRGFDRPNQNVFDLSMDYSDDEVLLDWEQYSGTVLSRLTCTAVCMLVDGPDMVVTSQHWVGSLGATTCMPMQDRAVAHQAGCTLGLAEMQHGSTSLIYRLEHYHAGTHAHVSRLHIRLDCQTCDESILASKHHLESCRTHVLRKRTLIL